MLTFPRWKGERTTRAAHAPRRIALHGLVEARVVRRPQRRRSARCRPGTRCHSRISGHEHARLVGRRRCTRHEGNLTGGQSRGFAQTLCGGDSGARRRSAHSREQRRRSGSRRKAVSFKHRGRNCDAKLRVELVPFYRHALPIRTARPNATRFRSTGKSDVDSSRKSLNYREYTRG
jgi:hypothetical protein